MVTTVAKGSASLSILTTGSGTSVAPLPAAAATLQGKERCPRVGKALAAAAGGPERRHRPCRNVHCAAGIAWLAVTGPETRQPETRGHPERGLLRRGLWAPALASGSRGGCSAACERGGAPRLCCREGGQGRRG